MKRIHVVAAIIIGQQQQILISRRPDHLHQGGLWEFPGGKVEVNEQPQRALARELREELAIEIEVLQPYMQISHDYPDKNVLLDIWTVRHTEVKCAELKGKSAAGLACRNWPRLSTLGHCNSPTPTSPSFNVC